MPQECSSPGANSDSGSHSLPELQASRISCHASPVAHLDGGLPLACALPGGPSEERPGVHLPLGVSQAAVHPVGTASGSRVTAKGLPGRRGKINGDSGGDSKEAPCRPSGLRVGGHRGLATPLRALDLCLLLLG